VDVRDVDVAEAATHLPRERVLGHVPHDGRLGGDRQRQDGQTGGEHEDFSHGSSWDRKRYAIVHDKALQGFFAGNELLGYGVKAVCAAFVVGLGKWLSSSGAKDPETRADAAAEAKSGH